MSLLRAFLTLSTIFFCLSGYSLTRWTFVIPDAASGSFSGSEAVGGATISGAFALQANGFKRLTLTAGTGSNRPNNGSEFFGLEVPGFAFFLQPILNNERKIIASVATGTCPPTPFTGNLGFSIWAGTAGTATDVSNAAVPAFGEFTWNPATNQATISNLRNLTAYATLSGFTPFNLTGTCTNGVITFIGQGDRGGSLYLTDTWGGVFVTNTNRRILILPQEPIPSASRLNATYSVFDHDASAHQNIYGSRMIVSGGTTATGDRRTDLKTDTVDASQTWTMSGISINTPLPGTFTANLTLEGSATRNCACAAYFRNRTTIFCVAQSPHSASDPINFVLVSDSPAWASGSLDSYGFGTGTYTHAVGSGVDQSRGVAIQADGRIVAAGFAGPDFAAVRYRADGTLDTSFASTGMAITTMVAGAQDRGMSVAIDSQNRVVVGGFANSATSNDDFALVRYRTNGSLDTAFNTTGRVITTVSTTREDRISSVAIDSTNKVVAAGYVHNGNNTDFALARYTTGGRLDTTFNGTGTVRTDVNGGGADQASTVLLQSNGRILVAGWDNNNFAVLRYLTNGQLDTSFSSDGISTINIGGQDRALSMAIQSNGRIILGGYANDGTSDNFAIARVTTNGNADATFQTAGVVITPLSAANADRINAVAVVQNDKIVAAGYVSDGTSENFAVARYLSDGALDTTFATAGIFSHDVVAGKDAQVFALAIQNDDKILLSGFATNTNADFALMRVWP